MNSVCELELATLEQIMDELGKRSAYGKFIFTDGKELLVGNEMTPADLAKWSVVLWGIAEEDVENAP